MKTLISIITPTYNQSAFIKQCIESVLSQTFTNWEMIVVDDCSSDNTRDVVTNYVLKDKRIKLIKHKNNWGIKRLMKTYNQALHFSHGEYIAILEGDDFWPKDKLEIGLKSFKNKNVVLGYGDWIMTDGEGIPIKVGNYRKYNKNLLNNNPTGSISRLFANPYFFLTTPTIMIEKKALVSIGGFKADKYYPFVDIPTILFLSLTGEFSYQQHILGYYRKQKNSSWFKFAAETNSMGRDEVQKCITHFLAKHKNILPKDLNLNISEKNSKKNHVFAAFLHYILFNEYKKAVKIAKIIEKDKNSSRFSKVLANILLITKPVNKYIYKSYFYVMIFIYKIKSIDVFDNK